VAVPVLVAAAVAVAVAAALPVAVWFWLGLHLWLRKCGSVPVQERAGGRIERGLAPSRPSFFPTLPGVSLPPPPLALRPCDSHPPPCLQPGTLWSDIAPVGNLPQPYSTALTRLFEVCVCV
jgi:hypothetical protein